MGSARGDTFRFILLGKTGSGKSSTGNTILGQELFESDVSFTSVTDDCQLRCAYNQGVSLEIMDSPGLFDTSKTQEEVSLIVMQAVAVMYPGPDAIFYVIKLGRYTEEEFAVYNRLKALFDEHVTRYMVVIFTHGDALRGRDIQDVLQTMPPTLQQVLNECGHRYAVFDNLRADKPPQVSRLLELVRHLRVSNGRVLYTCPKYASVGEKLEEELARRLEVVEEKELQNKKYVQELSSKLDEAEEAVKHERDEFQRKDEERQRAMKAREQEVNRQMGDMTQVLKQQQASEEEQRAQLKALQVKLDREAAEFHQKLERQRQEQEAELRRKDQEREEAMRRLQAEREAAERAAAERQAQELARIRQEAARCKRKKGKCSIM